jgi:hypothetical protein
MNKWRFVGNNYGPEYGLDTADMETFKKDPLASLARETCQNSIDARKDYSQPVRIEFKSFSLKNDDWEDNVIPDFKNLIMEIGFCRDYKKEDSKVYKELQSMLASTLARNIDCLRISDFNTTGLRGVEDFKNSPFYLLTKGTGVTNKDSTQGGSKGIGKFATFVTSKFNTVFYSTFNDQGESGHIGISKLCSRPMEDTHEKTIGTGYFSSDEKNSPIKSPIYFDPSLDNRSEFGTDIYILGFKKEKYWTTTIISKILESFMAAILEKDLVVSIDDIQLNHETIEQIINEDQLIEKSLRKSIKAQYLLIKTKENKEIIPIRGLGEIELYFTGYTAENVEEAINECVMVRHPLMKIKSVKGISQIPFSAVCIIKKNELNGRLRAIENPQHTDWEYRRIEDVSLRNDTKDLLTEIKDAISDAIQNKLLPTDLEETDIEGASEYLPDGENGEGNGSTEFFIDKPYISKSLKKKILIDRGFVDNDDTNVPEEDLGPNNPEEEGDLPSGGGGSGGGTGQGTSAGTDNPVEGEMKGFSLQPLSGIKYTFIASNFEQGEYFIFFDSPVTEKNCELLISLLDEGNKKQPIEIINAEVNKSKVRTKRNKIYNFELVEGFKYSIFVKTNQSKLFSCEVKMYAYR